MRSMDSILKDEPSVHSMPESAESDSRETSAAEPKTETQASEMPAPKSEAKVEAPKQAEKPAQHDDADEDEHTPDDLAGLKKALAAARGDKRKARKQWQDTERALAELRGRLSVMQQPPRPEQQQPKPQPIDLTEEDFFGKGPAAVKQYIEAREKALRDELRADSQAREDARRSRSVEKAKSRHDDFDEVWSAALEACKVNPAIEAQLLDEDDLGESAYRIGKEFLQVRGISSYDELKEKVRAEILAEMGESGTQPQQHPSPSPAKPQIPRSLAGARGTGAGIAPVWNGPRPMSEILRR